MFFKKLTQLYQWAIINFFEDVGENREFHVVKTQKPRLKEMGDIVRVVREQSTR